MAFSGPPTKGLLEESNHSQLVLERKPLWPYQRFPGISHRSFELGHWFFGREGLPQVRHIALALLSEFIKGSWCCYGYCGRGDRRDRPRRQNRHGFFSIFSDSNWVSNTRTAFQGSKELQSSKWRSSRLSLVFWGVSVLHWLRHLVA